MRTDLLADIQVLVTRPVHQAQAFCDMITQQGGQAIRLPVIEIEAIALSPEMTAVIDRLDKIDFAVFISPNAVELGLARLLAHGKIPDTLKLVTIGKASAQKMQQLLGRAADIYPTEQYNSEALLALDSLQSARIKHKKFIIFRGQTGRELLAQSLRKRGATVYYAEIYQCKKPQLKNSVLESIWGSKSPDIITVTSNEGLSNLLVMLDNPADEHRDFYLQQLWQTPLVVVTEKMRLSAQQSGFKNVIMVAEKASNEMILESVLQWAKIRKNK